MRSLLLVLALVLLGAALPAAPASNQRVGGGMLMGIGVPLAVIGAVNLIQPADSNGITLGRETYAGIAVAGAAATGLGAWLWVRGGRQPQVALSWRF
jgi:hypothetical protein